MADVTARYIDQQADIEPLQSVIRTSVIAFLLTVGILALVMAQSARTVAIRVNQIELAKGFVLGGEQEVVVAVPDIARAIDGDSVGEPGQSRLQLIARRLSATRVGNCAGCRIRIVRPVLISARARVVDDMPTIPLHDLAAAFEGRVEVDSARSLYTIHVGRCTWCILEPLPPRERR